MPQTTNQPPFRNIFAIASLVLTCVLFGGCSSFTPRSAVPISSITNAAENGQSEGQIINSMNTSGTVYALRGSDFARLADYGVPEPVLDALQQRFFAEVQFLTRNWYSNGGKGGPSSIYPQPLDLDNLEQGGNGMAPTANVGRITHGSRPQGVPKWVPPYPALNGPVVSASTVVDMTSNGLPTQEIVEAVLNSRVDTLYMNNNFAMSRARIAALTGSTYARFAQQGVAFEVLDALQSTYIAQHVERSRFTAPRGTGGFR
jgi:hypothetical protein